MPNSFYLSESAISDIPAETTKAYKSIRKVKQRPVDIVVGTVSRFEARKEILYDLKPLENICKVGKRLPRQEGSNDA